MREFKTAIVHDWFAGYAGSERCVESFTNVWSGADVYTLFNFLNPEEKRIVLKNIEPHTSFIERLPGVRKNHRKYLPLFPLAIEQFDLSDNDIIISSSHAVAKGALTNTDQLHICYCHTPIRYAWDLTHQYLKESGLDKGVKGFLAKAILHYIRIWDRSSASRVDYFIANSKYVAKRIKKVYGREAEVIYPPVDTAKFTAGDRKEEYYLTASRFVPYKKIDLIAEAFSQMPDKKLLIIGSGPDEEKIKNKCGKNVELLGYKEADELSEYMRKAKGFVFAADEDFGITVVEALSSGTPVIAFNKGGVRETVEHGKNGILFNNQRADSIIGAVAEFEQVYGRFEPDAVSGSAKRFDRAIFEQKMKIFVDIKAEEFFGRNI